MISEDCDIIIKKNQYKNEMIKLKSENKLLKEKLKIYDETIKKYNQKRPPGKKIEILLPKSIPHMSWMECCDYQESEKFEEVADIIEKIIN